MVGAIATRYSVGIGPHPRKARRLKQFLLTVAGVFFGLILFAIVTPLLLIALAVAAARPAPIPPRVVISLDLRSPLADQEPRDGIAFLAPRSLSVMGIEQTLARAARDARVSGLFVRLPDEGMSPAAADELRSAFKGFRASGKPILAYSQGLYAAGASTATYELAAASGDFWMQPASSFQATGLAQEDVFLRSFFDKHGVVPDFQQRYEYKNAINGFLYSDYTPAHREAELSWMGSVYATGLAAAAEDRGMAPPDLTRLIEAGPYSAEQANADRLVDHVGELKAAQDSILASAGRDARLIDYADYKARSGSEAGPVGAPAIAVIEAQGDIVTGTGGHASPFGGAADIYSDDLSSAFYRAIDDNDVRAIVFRVSSPGGSDTASEEILAAVRAAKAAGKPVVVSMGEYAASGGYWISSQASEIVAEPSTITGSIGVFGGKFALGAALSQFGIDIRHLEVGGAYADANGSESPMTPAQEAAFGAWMDRIYAGFVGRVAEGRRLPVQRVEAIARGHVWTGAQARQLGLVDYLGGFPLAVERAKALAKISGPVRLQPFSPAANPLAAFARLFGAGAEGAQLMSEAGAIARDPDTRALIQSLHEARLRSEGAFVLAPIPSR